MEDKKFNSLYLFGGMIGYVISCMIFLQISRTFRFHAILHHSAESVKPATKKDPGTVLLHLFSQFIFSWSSDWINFLFIC